MATVETVKQKVVDELEKLVDATHHTQLPYKALAETLEILDRVGKES